jgi:hypothetical protein
MATALPLLRHTHVSLQPCDLDHDDATLIRIRDLLSSLEADGGSDTSPTKQPPAATPTPSMTGYSIRSGENSPSSRSVTSLESPTNDQLVISETKPHAPRPSAALRLTQLPPGYSVTQLRILLGRFGAIKLCHVMLDAASKTTMADVVFEAHESATAALTVKPPLAIDGRAIGVLRTLEEAPIVNPPSTAVDTATQPTPGLPPGLHPQVAPHAVAYAHPSYHPGAVTYVQHVYPNVTYTQLPAMALAHPLAAPYGATVAYGSHLYAQAVAAGYGSQPTPFVSHPYATPSAYSHPAAYPVTYQAASMAVAYPAGYVTQCPLARSYCVPPYSPSVSLMPTYA